MNADIAPKVNPSSAGGQRGRRPAAKSRYGTQMAEKKNLKEIFNISETQLRKYFLEARRVRTATGAYLLTSLERRFDNAVFRAGFAPTRATARQLVSHAYFTINGRPNNIRSTRLSVGDVVTIKPGKRSKAPFAMFPKSLQNVVLPSWIELDPANHSFRVTSLPSGEEANLGVDIQAIVEFFAR